VVQAISGTRFDGPEQGHIAGKDVRPVIHHVTVDRSAARTPILYDR
jgi:hypothetical protein